MDDPHWKGACPECPEGPHGDCFVQPTCQGGRLRERLAEHLARSAYLVASHGGGNGIPVRSLRRVPPSDLVRAGEAGDAEAIGRLLHDFNREFDEPTPTPGALAERVRQLIGEGEIAVLLAGDGPEGFAVLRFRPSLYSQALESYLAELYVVPERRGRGLGRALMEAAIELARGRGADNMDLNTSKDDVAARALYESLGFTNREGRPDGPVLYYYEREL